MKQPEIEKSKSYITLGILDYVPDSVASKIIIDRATGSIVAMASDSPAGTGEKILPFDTFVQVIDGTVEIRVDHKLHWLETGQSIIIPAHFRHTIKSDVRFKLLSTIIKSGYEDAIL